MITLRISKLPQLEFETWVVTIALITVWLRITLTNKHNGTLRTNTNQTNKTMGATRCIDAVGRLPIAISLSIVRSRVFVVRLFRSPMRCGSDKSTTVLHQCSLRITEIDAVNEPSAMYTTLETYAFLWFESQTIIAFWGRDGATYARQLHAKLLLRIAMIDNARHEIGNCFERRQLFVAYCRDKKKRQEKKRLVWQK